MQNFGNLFSWRSWFTLPAVNCLKFPYCKKFQSTTNRIFTRKKGGLSQTYIPFKAKFVIILCRNETQFVFICFVKDLLSIKKKKLEIDL